VWERAPLSRGLLGFVVFVSLIAATLIGLAVFLGRGGISFVLHEERKSAPFVMVELLEFADDAAEARYRSAYAEPALALVQALGGERLWEARLDEVLAGGLRDAWPVVALVRYPSRAAFIDLVTSSEYRALLEARTSTLRRGATLAAAPSQAFEGAGGAFALRLVQGSGARWRTGYDSEWLAEDEALLERHGGRIAWRATLTPLTREDEPAGFEEIWLYAFADPAQRTAWSRDLERLTVQSLERRLLRRDVVLLMRPIASDRGAPPDPASEPSEPERKEVNRAERVELAEVRQRARLDLAQAAEAGVRQGVDPGVGDQHPRSERAGFFQQGDIRGVVEHVGHEH
jgi:uncharacterized protein (DUF1330 family)